MAEKCNAWEAVDGRVERLCGAPAKSTVESRYSRPGRPSYLHRCEHHLAMARARLEWLRAEDRPWVTPVPGELRRARNQAAARQSRAHSIAVTLQRRYGITAHAEGAEIRIDLDDAEKLLDLLKNGGSNARD